MKPPTNGTGVPRPPWVDDHMRTMTPDEAGDFADELLEREAIMGEFQRDAWREAFSRVVERRKRRL